jgi:hypothetical protein
MWLTPVSFGLIMLGTLLLLAKEYLRANEGLGFILFLVIIFSPTLLYRMLLSGKRDAIIEKFDKEPQDKKKRDNVLVIGFYAFAIIYFFSILFITGPVGHK